jgi:hypothetical protein
MEKPEPFLVGLIGFLTGAIAFLWSGLARGVLLMISGGGFFQDRSLAVIGYGVIFVPPVLMALALGFLPIPLGYRRAGGAGSFLGMLVTLGLIFSYN